MYVLQVKEPYEVEWTDIYVAMDHKKIASKRVQIEAIGVFDPDAEFQVVVRPGRSSTA